MAQAKKCPQCGAMIRYETHSCPYCSFRYSLGEIDELKNSSGAVVLFGAVGFILTAVLIYGIYVAVGQDAAQVAVKIEPEVAAVGGAVENSKVDTDGKPGIEPSDSKQMLILPQRSAATNQHGEVIATAINLNGFLCARVENVRPLSVSSDTFEVTCVEYRGGKGTIDYIVNTSTGVVFKR